MLDWRYPDKPIHSTLNFLRSISNNNYICQQKIDGWRICSYVNGKVDIFTRHYKKLDDALKNPVPENIIQELKELSTGSETIYDGEYLGRRTAKQQSIVLFDILKLDGKWITNMPYEKRFGLLENIINKRLSASKNVYLPKYCTKNFEDFYENQKKYSQNVEGIVLKRLDSTLVCSRKISVINPGWYKVKWKDN